MVSSAERRQKKNKKREQRIKEKKLMASQTGMTSEQRERGKLQIYLVFLVAFLGAAIIIYNFT